MEMAGVRSIVSGLRIAGRFRAGVGRSGEAGENEEDFPVRFFALKIRSEV
jgi:hypothetical protein